LIHTTVAPFFHIQYIHNFNDQQNCECTTAIMAEVPTTMTHEEKRVREEEKLGGICGKDEGEKLGVCGKKEEEERLGVCEEEKGKFNLFGKERREEDIGEKGKLEEREKFLVPQKREFHYPPGAGVHVPGEPLTTATTMLETGASLLQPGTPLSGIRSYWCGIEFPVDDMKRQIIGHHYCTHINEDLQQCLIYDTEHTDARLIGIEYIVSERLFITFPEEEKKLWHSHAFEVKGGIQVCKNVPAVLENRLMERLVSTYGKTFHFWQIDRDILPFGVPQLFATFTEESQIDRRILDYRDRELGVKSADLRKDREYIPWPKKVEGVDLFLQGQVSQLKLQ